MPRRPAPDPGHRVRLTRDRVLRAALDLADEKGIGALTMRELGQRLGVEAMSLYNHVDTKDDLLDGIVDEVIAEIELPPDEVGWREAMRARAVSTRAVFARHPWASALIDTRRSSGPGRLRYLDWIIGTLLRAGFTVERALHAVSALDSYTYGFERQQLGMSDGGGDDEETPAEAATAFLDTLPADEFPALREVTIHVARHGYDPVADFDFGLNLLLDGLERSVRDAPGPPSHGPPGKPQ